MGSPALTPSHFGGERLLGHSPLAKKGAYELAKSSVLGTFQAFGVCLAGSVLVFFPAIHMTTLASRRRTNSKIYGRYVPYLFFIGQNIP